MVASHGHFILMIKPEGDTDGHCLGMLFILVSEETWMLPALPEQCVADNANYSYQSPAAPVHLSPPQCSEDPFFIS